MESGATDDSRSLLSPENNLPLQGDFPPPPSSPGFPSPPRMFTPPPDEQNGSLEDLSEKGLSFDNPLANFAMGGNASEDEDNFDFTDADAAIDKMLDDLQDFQNVSWSISTMLNYLPLKHACPLRPNKVSNHMTMSCEEAEEMEVSIK